MKTCRDNEKQLLFEPLTSLSSAADMWKFFEEAGGKQGSLVNTKSQTACHVKYVV